MTEHTFGLSTIEQTVYINWDFKSDVGLMWLSSFDRWRNRGLERWGLGHLPLVADILLAWRSVLFLESEPGDQPAGGDKVVPHQGRDWFIVLAICMHNCVYLTAHRCKLSSGAEKEKARDGDAQCSVRREYYLLVRGSCAPGAPVLATTALSSLH